MPPARLALFRNSPSGSAMASGTHKGPRSCTSRRADRCPLRFEPTTARPSTAMPMRRILPPCESGDVCAVAGRQWTCQAFRAMRRAAADLKKGHLGAAMDQISYDDFAKIDIRVGRIVQAEVFPQARKPAYKLRIDFGEAIGVKNSSAQITKYYEPQDLVGKLVLGVVNFPPRQIATFFSEVLTLGVILGEGDICLIQPDRDVPLGSPIR